MRLAQANGDTDTAVDTATAILHLAFVVGMVALLVGGTVAIIVLWYVRGRDPATGMVAEYITAPPDDLPPGAAGTLLDERADHEDVVATLLGLARHGAIVIHEIRPESDTGRRPSDYELEIVAPGNTESRLERDLLTYLFDGSPDVGKRARLSAVKGRFDSHQDEIKSDLYQEMVDRGYFERSPEATRRRWRTISWIGVIGSVVAGVFLTVRTDAFALLPTVAAVIIWILLLRMSNAMPQKTRHGAESAAKWRAFRTYLRQIDKYENLGEARTLFDRYLSYAVAFGLEKQWIASFAAVGATSPAWFDSGGFGDAGGWVAGEMVFDSLQTAHMLGHLGGGDGVDVPSPGVPDVNFPDIGLPNFGDADLQGMAETMGSGLGSASEGLSGLLDAAGSIFDGIDFDW